MIDRFGLLPDPVKKICLEPPSLNYALKQLALKKIEGSATGGKLEFADDTQIEPISLVKLVQSQPTTYQLAGATALKFSESLEETEQRFDFIDKLLAMLTPDPSKNGSLKYARR